ncbi:hypothetical protein AWW66_25090 [Micromonospora rosaria]|uniref:Peptidase S9 prolyl oligopeptidase catalytic domain-containing protein n=1 Tax=Micromonospora rosaria TaxID=47874 RepID=A0A136PLK5_9ACTN|nr:hypothetical protein AWW66_25090 [Micromonospora rosaria]
MLVRPAGDDVDAENPYAQSDAVFDSAVRIWPEPLLRSLWYAARADLAVLDPHLGGRRTLCTGTVVADLAVAPDGRHVLAGIVEDLHDLRGLLTQDLINYRVYDTTRPRQPWNLGRLRHGSLRWTSESQPTLVFCDEGRSDEPTRFWTARLGADPVPIGQVTGLVTAWYPATSETVVLVSRQNGEYRLACSSDDTRILPLPGPVRRLARLEVTSRPVLAAFSRGPDGLRAQHLFRVDNGELILLGSAHYDRTVLHQDGEVRLVERRSGGQVSLTRETVTDARTLHRACLAPPPDPTRITTARLDSGAHYEVRRADQPECLPVMVWLVPVQEQEQDEPAPPSVPAPAAAAPGTPAWTYLPELAVVTLTCPLPWSPTATFDEIADRLRTTMVRLLSVLGEQEGLDTDRVVLGGHSFGAAAGAVLLSLLPGRFQCAVLRNGAYNRTLTPAGFQHEHRPFWQAPDIYDGFTATRVAHRISTPVLLVQSEADTNTSTTVVQARSLYDALVVAGCPVRLVLLHNEDHIVHTRQGILTAAREERAWIRRWLTGSTIDAANRQTEEVG